MEIDEFLKYVCCPKCKRDLVHKQKLLACEKCRQDYEIKDGIPILIDFDNLSEHQRKQVDCFENYSIMTTEDYKLEEWHKSFIRRFKDNFEDIGDKIVVDAGIGQGYMTVELAKAGAVLLSFDLVFPALVRLKRIVEKEGLTDRVFLVCCSAEELPFKTNTADYFVSNAVLEHLEEEKQAIEEMGRIGKERSGLMITVPLRYRYLNPLFVLGCVVQDRKIGHLRRYDEKSLQERFGRLGYHVKRVYYTGHFRKVVLTLLQVYLFKFDIWSEKCEEMDREEEDIKYGASNVCAIFQRS